MIAKTGGVAAPSFNRPGMAAPTPSNNPGSRPQNLVVGGKHLGAAGALSNSFGTTANSQFREKMQLKNMMAKASHEQYQSNPIQQKRLQHQIVRQTENLYGGDRTKAMAVKYALRDQAASTPGAPSAPKSNLLGGFKKN